MLGSVGVLGSGFGLYGYLPALVEAGYQQILMPSRYREKFSLRPELQTYAEYVRWVSEDSLIFLGVDTLVLALPPLQQLELLGKLLNVDSIKCFLLEKPLAQSPYASRKLLDSLHFSGKKFRIDYNFRLTSWGKDLRRILSDSNIKESFTRVSISWSFLAPHYRDKKLVWKRFDHMGGGALRFYGVHLVALLSEIGYTEVLVSEKFYSSGDELAKWTATFSGKNLPKCDVTVDTKALIHEFSVALSGGTEKKSLFLGLDPFDCNDNFQTLTGRDKRVPYLADFCREITQPDEGFKWYKSAIELWQLIEDKSIPACY